MQFYGIYAIMICNFIRSVKPSIKYNRIFAFSCWGFFRQGKLLANMGVSEWFWLNDCLCQIWLIKSMHTGNNPIIGGRSVKITSTAWKNKIINFLHNVHVHKSRGFLRSWWRNVLIVECLLQFSKNSPTSCQWQIWNDFSFNILFVFLFDISHFWILIYCNFHTKQKWGYHFEETILIFIEGVTKAIYHCRRNSFKYETNIEKNVKPCQEFFLFSYQMPAKSLVFWLHKNQHSWTSCPIANTRGG